MSAARNAPPTLDDVDLGIDALVAQFDPSLVLLYGSVHLGTATSVSDIDLCVVFDDIEYQRREARRVVVESCVETATGHRTDARIADWPEWIGMSNCVSTFERYVRDHSRVVHEREQRNIAWGKDLPVHPTDPCISGASLSMVLAHLERIFEIMADPHVTTSNRSRDMHELGALSKEIMEVSLMALCQAIPLSLPPRATSVRHLIDLVARDDPSRGALVDALGFTEPEKARSLSEAAEAGNATVCFDVGVLGNAALRMASICSRSAARLSWPTAATRCPNRRIQRLLRRRVLELPWASFV